MKKMKKYLVNARAIMRQDWVVFRSNNNTVSALIRRANKRAVLITVLLLLFPLQKNFAQEPATPEKISGSGGVTPYQSDLNMWTGSWQAPQALYDREVYQDSPDYWYHTSAHEGSTWYNNSSGYGILIVDLNQIRTINTFRVFQMFSDVKTTGIRIFRNTVYTGSTIPDSGADGWEEVTAGLTTMGIGTDNGTYISNPTDISVSDFQTRYIMMQVYNNGELGNNTYIELKGIKAFYVNEGVFSENFMRGGPGSPLPIVLSSFKATCNINTINITWLTESEFNNDKFIVEKSCDLLTWKFIAEIKGAGNSNSPMEYSCFDADPFSGISYYRLTQIDFDNKKQVFEPISHTCDTPEEFFDLYPNPAKEELNIVTNENEFLVEIVTCSGNVILSATNENNINISTLSPGVYLVRYITGSVLLQKTLIVNRL
jgi:hypothetical protein